MIIYIKGILKNITEKNVIVDVQGIGYEILMPQSLSLKLPPCENEVKIHTYDHVREDARILYGFITTQEKEMFEEILTVNGIGPKAAMNILSGLTPNEIINAVISKDIKSLTTVPGIGPKTAQRMVLELKDKFSAADIFALPEEPENGQNTSHTGDAIDALGTLGYARMDAMDVVKRVYTEGMEVEEILKKALKVLATI
ncbi:MAG TPA: Holliday junction branch migration protein RuvA [Epulopiscium sp.]|nr:Holliday junction branch migration protein RuvA [Candidatus Epulonipiscium sp.]